MSSMEDADSKKRDAAGNCSQLDGAAPCGGPRVRAVPPGDERERLMCPDCGYIAYKNPLIVVGSVTTWRGSVLLCRRAIDPQRGYWTLPAGFMEEHETTADGAAREAWEEARARIVVDGLLAVYDLPRISQVHILYRAELVEPVFSCGPESLDVRLFAWREIPWSELAFPTVRWALFEHRARLGQSAFAPAGVPTPERRAAWDAELGGDATPPFRTP